MVTTEVVISKMNAMTSTAIEAEKEQTEPESIRVTQLRQQAVQADDVEASVTIEPTQQPAAAIDFTEQNIELEVDRARETADDTEQTAEVTDVSAEIEQPTLWRSARIARGISQLERYLLLTKIQEVTEKLITDKEQAKFDAIQKEILQIFEELKAVMPVMKDEVPEDAEVLRCFIFLVEKFLANGEFEKIKARLVANGAQQNRDLYPNKSSPTASIHAIFTCMAIVAYIGNYAVAKIDVKGAYIQMQITGSLIYMKMDKKLTMMALSILPSLQKYVTPEGTLYMKLLKALYGCVQSGQLWCTKIKRVLWWEGYIATPTDQCIFRKVSGNHIWFLILYVDDILLFANDEEIKRVETFMKKEFKWITVIKDKIVIPRNEHRVSKNQITVDMHYYTQQLLKEFTSLQI
jgi:hypothetical protein